MSDPAGPVMAVAITHHEAKVWTSTTLAGTAPERFVAPTEGERHRHTRVSHEHPDRQSRGDTTAFFESVTEAVSSASRIVLVGHGRGKANEMLHLIQYWERRHPDLAQRVVGAMDSDLESLSDHQILALVREWYGEHHEFI